MVSDLGSGNGTLLNGEALVDETALADGDVITLGDTELRFDGDGQARDGESAGLPVRRAPVRTARNGGAIERAGPRGRPVRTARGAEDPASARAQSRKRLIRVGAVAVVVLGLLGGWKAIDSKRQQLADLQRQATQTHKGELADLFKEAKGLVKQGRWADAKDKLLVIKATDPEFEPRQIANYLAIAEKEIPNQAVLEQVNGAITAGELGKAASLLKTVKVSPQAENAVRRTREALDAKAVEKLAEARTYAPTRDLASQEKVKALAEDVLAVHEEDRDAAELKRSADSIIRAIKNPSYAPPPAETPWLEVQARFKNGDATGAMLLAQACTNKQPQCRELELQMKEWELKSKKVEDLSEAELISLFELDRKIAGGTSSDQSRPIRTQLVSRLFVKASQLKTTQNWNRAIEYARRVLQADPNHLGAQALLNEGRNQAKDIYLRAYQLKNHSEEEAVKLFKEVLSMTPADDEYHQKARDRLADMQKQ